MGKQEATGLGEYLTVRIDHQTKAELEALAAANDRTVVAEIRRAIRRYLENEK